LGEDKTRVKTDEIMSRFVYQFGRWVGRAIGFQTMQIKLLHAERFDQPGGYVLACTHLSHLEPAIVSSLMRRKIDWMARIEFYRYRVMAAFLRSVGAFPVNRFGVPVKAIRSGIHRAQTGRIVGIFPEGGVVSGGESVLLGGSIKLGACVIAIRAGVPIVPVVVLGTPQLVRVSPWIPWRRIKLRLAFGAPIYPPTQSTSRRKARREMGEQLRSAYRALYAELCDAFEIPPEAGTTWPDGVRPVGESRQSPEMSR